MGLPPDRLVLEIKSVNDSFRSSRRIPDRMAIDAGIVLLRKRPLGLPSKTGTQDGIEQTQKHFLRKTRQGRVQKGESLTRDENILLLCSVLTPSLCPFFP